MEILLGGLTITLLHSLLPNHWLPIVAIGRREEWSVGRVLQVTLLVGTAHALSTVVIGVLAALLGWQMTHWIAEFSHWVAPAMLILLGIFFIYRHHTHHHFHLQSGVISQRRLIWTLAVAMFFSPCLEIGGFFLMAGTQGWAMVALLSLFYCVLSVLGMVLWVQVAYHGLRRMDWHGLEHRAGIISGAILILTGILAFWLD